MALAAGLVLGSSLSEMVQPQQAAPAAAQAEAQHALPRQMLAMLERDEGQLRAFIDTNFADKSADGEPREVMLARVQTLARQSGGVEVSDWETRGSRHFFEGMTRKGGLAVDGMVVVQDGKILHFEMRRNLQARGPDAPAWPPAGKSAAEAIPLIQAEIDWRAKVERFSGAVLLAHRGKPVLEGAWGLARRSPDRPNRPTTMFTTASSTKMLTTTAIGRLIDQGKLSLDTHVAQAVPAMASAPGATGVTIRDLLGHRVSYGEYFEANRVDPLIETHKRATELLTLLGSRTPLRAPDGQVEYSNANYLVLAAAVEAVSGRSFYDFVHDEVLRPARMEHTRYLAEEDADHAFGWIKDEVTDPLGIGDWQTNAGRNGGRRGGPAGGALSTARDMWQLVDGLAAGRLIKPATLDTMLADRRRVGPTLSSALGFMSRGGEALNFFGHSGGGGNAGVSTAAYVTPDREWAVVVLSNFSSPSGEMLAGQIMDYLQTLRAKPGQ